jgi:iron complex transport system ATP-binding protein
MASGAQPTTIPAIMKLLSTERLSIGYSSRPLLRDVELSLEAGNVICLIGPNGVGKTTLFRTLLGLVPPLRGTIRIGGDEMQRLSRTEIAKRVAYVPQAYTGTFAFTVLDLVLMGRTAHLGAFSTPTREDIAAAESALESVGIDVLAHRNADQISGGQLQLALIARALAQTSRLILMDEPTASLDIANRHLVTNKIKELAARGLSVALSTHEPDVAFSIASQVALLGSDGRFQVGPAVDLLTGEHLTRLYGVPLTVETTSSGRRVVSPS